MIRDGNELPSWDYTAMSRTTVDRLKRIMEMRNVSQADLSKETKIAPAQINRYLAATTPSGANLVKIAKALNSNASFLLGETEYHGPLDERAEAALADLKRDDVIGAFGKLADSLREVRNDRDNIPRRKP